MAIWYDCGNGWAKTTWARAELGADVYLCCPGPSLAKMAKGCTQIPGALTMALTTAYPTVRPDVWVGMDGPECYNANLLREPFVKIMRGPHGKLGLTSPNLYFADVADGRPVEIFQRRAHDTKFVWQNDTLTVALHLAVWMGAKRIHLVGMDLGGKRDYCDGRTLTAARRADNRRLYAAQAKRLKAIAAAGKEHGVSFTSCTPGSPVNDFLPYLPLSKALKATAARYRSRPQPVVHVADAENCRWRGRPEKGVVIGCDSAQEWMLDWWWNRYKAHNALPVAFADFGMTDAARLWCQSRGALLDCRKTGLAGWFNKPVAILATPFNRNLWLDVDCEVRGDVRRLFKACPDPDTLGLVHDTASPAKYVKALPKGAKMFNSGIILTAYGEPIIAEWAKRVFAELGKWPGDQDILSAVVFEATGAKKIHEFGTDLVQLRLSPVGGDCVVKHWTGPEGKRAIREQISLSSTSRPTVRPAAPVKPLAERA